MPKHLAPWLRMLYGNERGTMKSIKFGILAIICLLYLMWGEGDIEDLGDEDGAGWTHFEAIRSISYLLAFGGFFIFALGCLLIPAEGDKDG